jgi:hypothetical protein
MECLASDSWDTGERVFLVDLTFAPFWLERNCPLRSSERWRRKQRLRGMPSLPDIRHQIAMALCRRLNC